MTFNCTKTYRTSAVTLTGGDLYLTIPGIQFNTLPNYTNLNVVVCQPIPAGANTAQVFLSDGITNVEVRNLSGNYLRADEIRCRKCYPMIFGNDPVHASLRINVCRSSYTGAAAAAAAVASATTLTASVDEPVTASTTRTKA